MTEDEVSDDPVPEARTSGSPSVRDDPRGQRPAIVVRGLQKRFGELQAVAGIDFVVHAGECLGVLGPNGAGKSTTVKMITCFSPLTSGSIEVHGLDVTRHPREVKARLGICAQDDSLDPDFSVLRNLLVYARYFGIPRKQARHRADELLEFVQLTEKRHSPVDEISGGMRRRLALARALLNQPEVLVLDEPTTGLDPQARQLIWERLRQLIARGITVLLTTHYMEEASRLCDRVILMDEGRILLEGPPGQLVENEIGREVTELWNVAEPVRGFLQTRDWPVEEASGRIYVYDRIGGQVGTEIGSRFPSQERLIRHATLEDVFLQKAGRSLRE